MTPPITINEEIRQHNAMVGSAVNVVFRTAEMTYVGNIKEMAHPNPKNLTESIFSGQSGSIILYVRHNHKIRNYIVTQMKGRL
jgi:hypothetical protein